MLSSGFGPDSETGAGRSGQASGSEGWAPLVGVSERAAASRDAEDSGTGEWVDAGGAASWRAGGGGAAGGGAGSLARGALTEVSPVNGFLYSVADVMTSTAVGL